MRKLRSLSKNIPTARMIEIKLTPFKGKSEMHGFCSRNK